MRSTLFFHLHRMVRLGATLGVVALLAVGCSDQRRYEKAVHAATDPVTGHNLTPDEALALLMAGNDRFVHNHSMHPDETPAWRHRLERGQHPFATILGCSDSRVPPELLFDQGFGDLFVIRVAGNIIDPDTAGSIEYAVEHLHTPIVLVLGHESCGAVTAALQSADAIAHEPEELAGLLKSIRPGLRGIDPAAPPETRVAAGVEANVRRAMAVLHEIPDIKEAAAAGSTRIVGGIYNLHTGAVELLEGS